MVVLVLAKLILDMNAEKVIELNGTRAKKYVGTVMILVTTNVTMEIFSLEMVALNSAL